MACNRPIYYPFLSDAAQQRIDAIVADCIQGRITEAEYRAKARSERVESRQENRSERVESRTEAAEEIGYYATDALFSQAIPAAAGAVASAFGPGLGGMPSIQMPQPQQAPQAPQEQPLPAPPVVPAWAWVAGLAALAAGVYYVR